MRTVPEPHVAARRPLALELVAFGLVSGAGTFALALFDYGLLVERREVTLYLVTLALAFAAFGAGLGRSALASSARLPVAARPIADRSTASVELRPREREVLELLAAGLSNREIGERLFVSESTVRTHARTLYAKLGARRRTEAVRIARERGCAS